MNKKSFVQAWGRKMFFGMGWALTSLVGLNYFQSMIIPQSTAAWAYFLTTFVGHYGLILSLVYFLLYLPVITLFPSYYISRLWLILLILAVNVLIFFDSYLFSRYRFHLNSFFWDLLQEKEALDTFGLSSFKIIAIGIVAAVIFIAFWVRGEKLWRKMQTRFSNPLRSWYLFTIVMCIIASQFLYTYGDARGSQYTAKLSSLFPMHFAMTGKGFLEEHGVVRAAKGEANLDYKDFYYPSQEMVCPMKQPKNVLLIVMDKWNFPDYNEYLTPHLHHFASHGLLFKNHYSGGLDKISGYFSLLYSLPSVYSESVVNQSTEPAFLGQLRKTKTDMTFFQQGQASPLASYQPDEKEVSIETLESHLADRDDLSVINPFFMQVYIEGMGIPDKDREAKKVIDLFIKHGLINDTIVVITAAHADQFKTPLIMIWPEKGHAEFTKMTSHYDILPTIMLEDWKCKNPAASFSMGENIFTKKEADSFIAGDYKRLKLLDLKQKTITTINQSQSLEVRGLETMELMDEKRDTVTILDMLQKLTIFHRR